MLQIYSTPSAVTVTLDLCSSCSVCVFLHTPSGIQSGVAEVIECGLLFQLSSRFFYK